MTPKIHVQTMIGAPIDRVWSIAGDFNSLPVWHPAIIESTIEKGEPSEWVAAAPQVETRPAPTPAWSCARISR